MRSLLLFLPLLAHAQIAGTVVDAATNTPLTGAKLSVNQGTERTTTDAAGRYRLSNLKPGDYYLSVEKDGYATQERLAVRLAPGEAIANFAIRLSPESTITGFVRNAQRPVLLSLTKADSKLFVAIKQTEPDGTFRFAGLPPGKYALSANNAAAQVIQLSPGEHKTGIEVTIVTPKTVTIRGRFAGDLPQGEPVFVVAEAKIGDFYTPIGGGRADADGRFTLQASSGESRIKLQHMTRPPIVIGYLDLTVPETGLDNVIVPRSPLRRITVKFRWRTNSAPVPGPLGISLNPMERIGILQSADRAPDGTITLDRVSPDRYSVLLHTRPPNAYVHSILAGGADISKRGLDLITGTATDLEILLATDGATVTGKVVDASGQPVLGAQVSIFPTSPDRPVRELQFRPQVPSAQGQFTETAIAPGEYQITARSNGKVSAPQIVNLKPNARINVELKLP